MKQVENTIALSEITPIEVYETIKDLNNKRSTHTFELSTVVLKTVNPAISEILCDLFFTNVLGSCIFLRY